MLIDLFSDFPALDLYTPWVNGFVIGMTRHEAKARRLNDNSKTEKWSVTLCGRWLDLPAHRLVCAVEAPHAPWRPGCCLGQIPTRRGDVQTWFCRGRRQRRTPTDVRARRCPRQHKYFRLGPEHTGRNKRVLNTRRKFFLNVFLGLVMVQTVSVAHGRMNTNNGNPFSLCIIGRAVPGSHRRMACTRLYSVQALANERMHDVVLTSAFYQTCFFHMLTSEPKPCRREFGKLGNPTGCLVATICH